MDDIGSAQEKRMDPVPAFEIEQALLELPGAPDGWIWAFTCPVPGCACRTAIVLFAPGDRAMLLERGQPVAEAWREHAGYGEVAEELQGVTSFAVDVDTLELFPPLGDEPLEAAAHPDVAAVVARFDDDVLDAIARVWYRGKGEQLPPEPGADGAKIEVKGWRPGKPVVWEDVRPALRGDLYDFGERIFEAFELYCAEPGCNCSKVSVDFKTVLPRGASHPGYVELDAEAVTLHPAYERQRERLTELWHSYCERHPRYQERLARRSATVHGLAGRIVAPLAAPKVSRNAPCPCGSGKKFKTCCGAA